MPDRAILFIDGNNWYHALKDVGVPNRGDLDYGRISQKLVGSRTWLQTRYYICVPQFSRPGAKSSAMPPRIGRRIIRDPTFERNPTLQR